MRTIAWGVSLAATLVLAISSAASAAVVTASAPGVFQQDLGAGIATFESVSPVNSNNPNPTSPGPFSDGPGDWSGVGVIANGTTAGVYAQPLNDSTDYLAVVADPVRTPETLELDAPATMLNLYWGSIDTYNVIEFFLGATLVDTVTGTQTLPLLADGNQTSDLSNRLVTITLEHLQHGCFLLGWSKLLRIRQRFRECSTNSCCLAALRGRCWPVRLVSAA